MAFIRVGRALLRVVSVSAVMSAAVFQFGAAPANWPYIEKADPPTAVHISACPDASARSRCAAAGAGASAETLVVGPGLTIAERRQI